MPESELAGIVWLPLPKVGNAVQVVLAYLAPGTLVSGWPGRRSMGTSLVGALPLQNGETVWVVAHDIELSGQLARAVAWWGDAQLTRDGIPLSADIRGALFGHDKDTGMRWFVDVALSRHAQASLPDRL
jgi:hypothetical protein